MVIRQMILSIFYGAIIEMQKNESVFENQILM